jgi:hypothetical protein
MKKVVRLTENDLVRLVEKVISEQNQDVSCLKSFKFVPEKKKVPGSSNAPVNAARPAYYDGQYEGKPGLFYLNGSVRLILGGFSYQWGKWACESGKIRVFDLQKPFSQTPM